MDLGEAAPVSEAEPAPTDRRRRHLPPHRRLGTPNTPINVGCAYLAKEYNRESVLSLFGALTAIAVNVPVRVDAPLPADVLQIALEEAESIFRPGGVIWEWSLDPGEYDPSPAVMVHVEQRPADFVVFGCSRDRHDHRLGHTHLGSRRITLWAGQVARAVDGDWDRAELPDVDERVLARALGRVLAHELGHLFLRLNGHREDGLMRGAFSHRSLTSRSRRGFLLSKRDMERLRASLGRYSRVARSERK